MDRVAGSDTARCEQRHSVVDDEVEVAIGPCVDLPVLAAEREECAVAVLVDGALPDVGEGPVGTGCDDGVHE